MEKKVVVTHIGIPYDYPLFQVNDNKAPPPPDAGAILFYCRQPRTTPLLNGTAH